MRIVILAHNLRVAGGLSVGQNIVSLLGGMLRQHQCTIFIPKNCGYENMAYGDNIDIVRVPCSLPLRLYWDAFQIGKMVDRIQPDWIWALGNVGVVKARCAQSILFHDPHLIYPNTHYPCESMWYRFKKNMLRRKLRRCLKSTQTVYCQTNTARERFARSFNFPIERIGLCPNAVSAFSSDENNSTLLPERLRPYAERYKLFVLTKCYGHKNLSAIIDMYARYRSELRGTVCVWTIEESQHRIAPGLLGRIADEGLEDLIVNVGPLQQSELRAYFNACDALFLPTLLESFSGTYLEAMHFGRPVITSDLDFAHDVCGDAAVYVDPWSIESMKNGILRIKSEPGLGESLVAAGEKRLKTLFRSWPDIVSSVLEREGIPYA